MRAFDLSVTYDDGRAEQVRAGQRECAAFEREPFGCSTRDAMDRVPMLFVRYLAYAALKRTRRLDVIGGRAPTFDVWDAGVDLVADAAPDVEQDEADPTTPDQPPAG